MIRDHLHADPAARHGLPVAPDLASAGSHARPTVLVVDDVAANIQVLAEILKTEYQVLFATSGTDALRIARAKEPDLVLLDVMMPDMDGLTVCARLKADPTMDHIPVIFVTAMGEVADETKGLAVGAIDYITKPVSPPIVRSRVRNHLELKRQRDLLRHIALVDGLTGIANRRRFDEIFAEEWRRAQRRQASLSLIIGDVDHFKGYNDHYGHQAGDECLKAVAQSMAGEMIRSGDVAARFGGEEFVCLLPDTDRDGARQVAERIRAALTRLALAHEASQVAGIVTLSLGIATTIPKAGTNPGDLLALADSHLYEAKKAGRNRACGGVLETVHALVG
ncbi:MAG: diguanylate cyclase [Rhodospirillales bacterium]|nr:diguanylate cyclase [Rhodospirillales bacterium]